MSKDKKAVDSPILVACDDGYAETKVVLEDGSSFRFPSMVKSGGFLGAANDEVHSYDTEGADGQPARFTVTGEFDAEASNTRFDGYHFSAENRVMIHHALRRAGLGGRPVELATSLPVADFFDGEGTNTRLIQRKSFNAMKAVQSSSNAPCADIRASKVFAEGVSAWLDFSLSDDLTERVPLKGSAAVVDIGGRTTDIVKVLRGMAVQKSSSGTANVGVLNFFDELAAAMARNAGVQTLYPGVKAAQFTRAMLADVLAIGRMERHGEKVDLQDEVRHAKQIVVSNLMREIESRVGAGVDLDHLLFVGGGAAVFEDQIKARYRMASIVSNPEFANARGMLKAMRLLRLQKL